MTSAPMTRTDVLKKSWTTFLVLAAAGQTIHPEHESDAYWHMSLGRAVLAEHSRVVAEPLALPQFTSPSYVPEWLWGVATYKLFLLGSWPLLVFFSAFVAGLAAFLCVTLVDTVRDGLGFGPRALVTGLGVAALISRLRLRPEAAGIVLLLAFLIVSYRYIQVSPEQRSKTAIFLPLIVVLCAQLHGSFVLTPALFLGVVGPTLIGDRLHRERWTVHIATFLGIVGALFSSAYGFKVADYISAHAHGDSLKLIWDMAPTTWESFNPSRFLDDPFGVLLLTLWTIGVAGSVVSRRLFVGATLVALLGFAVAWNAIRFLSLGALLALPLATEAIAELTPHSSVIVRTLDGVWLAVATTCVGVAIRCIDLTHGSIGSTGPADGVHPLAAAKFLSTLPTGGRVLSVYNAGGALGYVLGGHSRIYVDGRTPLYFDEADFGLSREVLGHPDALARAIGRFGATAVVVERTSPVCGKLPSGWVPAVIEPTFTTFVPESQSPTFGSLAPCGNNYFKKNACERPEALDDEIARLASTFDAPFIGFLRAERIARCGGDWQRIPALLPSHDRARSYRSARDAVEVSYLLHEGQFSAAADVVRRAVRHGDPRAATLLVRAITSDALSADVGRSILSEAIAILGDESPPELRAVLALACAADGDAGCVEIHGFRAAARGANQVVPALLWLRKNDPSARGREDARAWLEVLESDALRAAPTRDPSTAPSASALPSTSASDGSSQKTPRQENIPAP